MLLRRHDISALSAISRLAGMQAQAPLSPYVGLWTRLQNFDPASLSSLLLSRSVVRGWLMRSTVHLVSAEDFAAFRPCVQEVLRRNYSGQPFGKPDVNMNEVIEAGLALLREAPQTRGSLASALAPLFPAADPAALGFAMTYLVPVVQIPPRGVWGSTGPAALQPAADWISRPVPMEPTPAQLDALVLRYFAAFGPATVRDAQLWSGLTKLREVVERLGSALIELPGGYYDLPDAPRPSPDVPAPVRFLPQYDNLLLSHAVRTRFITDARRVPLPPGHGAGFGSVLVDGFWRADWRMKDGNLYVEPFSKLSKAEQTEVDEEGDRLLAFLNS